MGECIERETVFSAIWKTSAEHDVFFPAIILDAIKSIPAADVRPVVKGFNKLKDYPSLFECSVCGWECGDTVPGDTETYNFCPNCGARMEES